MSDGQPITARAALLRHVATLAAIVALVAAHGAILRVIAGHRQLSLAVVAALGGVIAFKHLGLLGLCHGALRRRRRRDR